MASVEDPDAHRTSSITDAAYALYRKGLFGEAESCLVGVLNDGAESAHGWFLLGVIRKEQGRSAEAVRALDCALSGNPAHFHAISAKAEVLMSMERAVEARQVLSDALLRHPAIALLWTNLGVICEQSGDFQSALDAYDRALSLDNAPVAARMNRGYVLSRLGRLDLALANNRMLVDRTPDEPAAHFNLAEVLLASDRPEECLQACATALSLDPNHAKTYVVSGLAHSALGHFEFARTAFDRARNLAPEAMRNFVSIYDHRLGSGEERFDPELIFLSRGAMRLHHCDWRELDVLVERYESTVRTRFERGSGINEPAMAYDVLTLPLSSEVRTQLACALGSRLEKSAKSAFEYRTVPAPKRRLRVAYMSADFREHLNGHLLLPIMESHDRANFDVIGFSIGPADASDVRKRIETAADEFVDVSALPANEIAAAIHDSGTDILVDVSGYTTFSRPDVLPLCPAPIQVSYLGFPGTLGMQSVQYRITDRIATPTEQEKYWTESLVYLPDTFYVYDPAPASLAYSGLRRRDYGLPDDAFIYCSFNNYYKIEPGVFGIWTEILQAVPGSVLWLAGRNETAVANLRREAESRGVSPQRLFFAPMEERNRYLARFALADLFLDTFIFNAMTTACDALAAGLPLLTCPGTTFTSRVAASLLTASRFTEGIVQSAEDYRKLAIFWGRNPQQLRDIRRAKLSNPLSSPLFDARARVRQLEAAYREMWRRYEQDLPPESFEVSRSPAAPAPHRWF